MLVTVLQPVSTALFLSSFLAVWLAPASTFAAERVVARVGPVRLMLRGQPADGNSTLA